MWNSPGRCPSASTCCWRRRSIRSLAQHEGYAELRAWEEPKAYILMGGGCQGCAVSAMTLRSGIERTLKDQIPEILEVVDVTDHASGTNPYYEPAKK
nr:NifU family protein [Candidatus Microthrix sp.]